MEGEVYPASVSGLPSRPFPDQIEESAPPLLLLGLGVGTHRHDGKPFFEEMATREL